MSDVVCGSTTLLLLGFLPLGACKPFELVVRGGMGRALEEALLL
jgi:hypothetical protein